MQCGTGKFAQSYQWNMQLDYTNSSQKSLIHGICILLKPFQFIRPSFTSD